MEDGGAEVGATEPEGVWEPEEAPRTGDAAPGSRPAQLHAQVAGAALRPLPDDRPEFCRGRNECFRTPTHTPPASWVPGQTLHNLSRTEKCLVVKLPNAGCAVILKILMTA